MTLIMNSNKTTIDVNIYQFMSGLKRRVLKNIGEDSEDALKQQLKTICPDVRINDALHVMVINALEKEREEQVRKKSVDDVFEWVTGQGGIFSGDELLIPKTIIDVDGNVKGVEQQSIMDVIGYYQTKIAAKKAEKDAFLQRAELCEQDIVKYNNELEKLFAMKRKAEQAGLNPNETTFKKAR